LSINASGQIVGDYYDGGEHGFLYSGGVYTTIDVSGSVDTEPRSINDSGQIGGLYQDSNRIQHGFLATPDTTAPAMLDAVQGRHHLTLLSGTAEVGSSVSVFDGTKLVGTATERHREFIARFATERTRLREPQMMRIGRPATAYKTGLFDHVPDMIPIANTARFRERENAFIDLRYSGLLGDALIINRSVLWMD
jgi:hypothetical protein